MLVMMNNTLPIEFEQRTRELLALEWDDFCRSLQSPSPTSIRSNDKLPSTFEGETVPWCADGLYLESRPSFTFDPLFHAGCYYVQEASSMFLYQVVKQLIGEAVVALDLCAAPGGKSTLLSQYLPEGSVLVSNEIVRQRANVLSENIQKWGNSNNIVTNASPADFAQYSGLFDLVLVDAPCSGEGMFRKDANAIEEWSLSNVRLCAERQKQILTDVWSSLKEDGILVYSTCTYNSEENEDNVKWICSELGAEVLHLNVDEAWGVRCGEFGYRFFPHLLRGEGLFMAVLRKQCVEREQRIRAERAVHPKVSLNALVDAQQYVPLYVNGVICAVEQQHEPLLLLLQKTLRVLHAGVSMYEEKGRDLVPQAGLALSKRIDRSQFVSHNVDSATAIAYLQKENIHLCSEQRGFQLLCVSEVPIGWVKNLGNRSNNLYPTEWRIRSKGVR